MQSAYKAGQGLKLQFTYTSRKNKLVIVNPETKVGIISPDYNKIKDLYGSERTIGNKIRIESVIDGIKSLREYTLIDFVYQWALDSDLVIGTYVTTSFVESYFAKNNTKLDINNMSTFLNRDAELDKVIALANQEKQKLQEIISMHTAIMQGEERHLHLVTAAEEHLKSYNSYAKAASNTANLLNRLKSKFNEELSKFNL